MEIENEIHSLFFCKYVHMKLPYTLKGVNTYTSAQIIKEFKAQTQTILVYIFNYSLLLKLFSNCCNISNEPHGIDLSSKNVCAWMSMETEKNKIKK